MLLRYLITTALISLSLFIAACQSNKNGIENGIGITKENLIGSWELVSVNKNGKTKPSETSEVFSGFEESGGPYKLQYRISEDLVWRIFSSKTRIESGWMALPFRLEGNKLIYDSDNLNTTNPNYKPFIGAEVTYLTANNMTIVLPSVNTEEISQFNFVRISEAQLATNTLEPAPETLSYKIKFGDSMLTDTLSDANSYEKPIGKTHLIGCGHSREPVPSFQLTARGAFGNDLSIDENVSTFGFETLLDFDYSKKSEELEINLVSSTKGTLSGSHTSYSNFFYELDEAGNCKINIKRFRDRLQIAAECKALKVIINYGARPEKINLSMNATCNLYH